jgi:hypothetical protein
MFGDDSKLRLRKSHANVAPASQSLLDCEEGQGSTNPSGSGHNPTNQKNHQYHHHPFHHHNHPLVGSSGGSISNIALPSLGLDPPPPSYGQIKGRRKRTRRRKFLAEYCKLCVSGFAATIVSATLSLTLLPFSWTQVDYHHQVQHEFEFVYQVLEDNRRNYNTLIRGIHHHERQIKCADSSSIGFENDDYCDCVGDGSDEFTTGACSHVTVGKKVFQCHKDRDIWILASRVGDGIPDCPDGSDEQ